jgi:hypothetical protein
MKLKHLNLTVNDMTVGGTILVLLIPFPFSYL